MTPLGQFLRDATPEERTRAASLGGTSVAYLYQIAGCHRKNIGVNLAMGIELGTMAVAADSEGRLTGVTVQQLATMCLANDF